MENDASAYHGAVYLVGDIQESRKIAVVKIKIGKSWDCSRHPSCTGEVIRVQWRAGNSAAP